MLHIRPMIENGVPDAPPPEPLRCLGCQHLVTRHHPAGTLGPHGTSARCLGTEGGPRRISWEWQRDDRPPGWCPKRSASR